MHKFRPERFLEIDSQVADFRKFELAGVLCAAASVDDQLTASNKHSLADKMRNLSIDIPCDSPTPN
jgi:hypothetical protein